MAEYPFVSIIIPIRNEADYIERALNAVLSQVYPPEKKEILIMDGMSSDNTRAIIENIVRQHDLTVAKFSDSIDQQQTGTSKPIIELLDNPKQIVPTALNIALRKARGEIIIRVDGHCEIASDYVRICVQKLHGHEDIVGVGGPIETIGETYVAETIAIAMSSVFGVGGSAFRVIKDRAILVDSIAFPAYKRDIIDKAGLFDEELVRNQDDEYNYRIRKMGGKLLLVPEIRSRYYSRASLRKLWRQYYQYGFWKVRVLQKHPRQMSIRQFAPPLFVLSLVFSISFGSILAYLSPHSSLFLTPDTWNMIPVVFCLIPGAYVLANLAASVYTSSRRGWRYLPLLPVVYAILHVSYGLGFLVGLVLFLHRWNDKQGRVPASEPKEYVSEHDRR